MIHFRKATHADIDAIEQSYLELFAHENTHTNYTGWVKDVYPTRATAEKAVDAGTMYVLESQGEFAAGMILNHQQAEEYAQIPWKYPAEGSEVLVVHTLCVRPRFSGRGFGHRMIEYALSFASEHGCKVVRLDTGATNHPAAALYASMGFRFAGKAHVFHEGVIDEDLIYFEYDLHKIRTQCFDPSETAVINPENLVSPVPDCPKTVVSCFADNLLEYAVKKYGAVPVADSGSANGAVPLYRIPSTDVGLVMSRVGAPAAVGQYEELFAMGVERMLVFGTCGVLDSSIGDCAIIIPDCAVRDEGTSRFYAPESPEIAANVGVLDMLKAFFSEKGISHTVGKVWTTDAFYRETPARVTERKAQGCIAVEMECAALAALAQFRGKQVAQFFYAADNLDAELWDERTLANEAGLDEKYAVVNLVIECAKEWCSHA